MQAQPAPVTDLETTHTQLSPPPVAPARDLRRERAAEARERGRVAARRLASMAQMTEFHPGDVIADRYRVNAVIGRGRGLLLDAAHVAFDQRVVARVISPALADAKAVDRFQRETRILSKLETDYVARIIDVGTLPNGALYLVREYLDGVSLAEHARSNKLDVSATLDLFLQVCEAVQEAHSRGVVLRDLQPGHVFLTHKRNGEPVAKLTDFGTCKVMRKSDSDEQSCTKLLGLSSSASPELVRQMKHIDERADIWSLGCLLYELLTGVPAFQGDGTMLMLAIANDHPVPPSSLRRDVDIPAVIDQVVMRSLDKSRSGRFQTVYQLASALRPLVSARGQLLINQIARLAGEEPVAVQTTAAVPTAAESSDDGTMTFSRSLRPSEPPPSYAAGAPFPLATPSVPAPASIPAPTYTSASGYPAPSSYPAPPSYPAAQYGIYASAPQPHASYPPVLAQAQLAAALRAPALPADLVGDVDMSPPRQSTVRKLLMGGAVALTPVAVVLLVFVLAQGTPVPAVAQAGWDIPSVKAVVSQVETAEAPAAVEAAEPEAATDIAEAKAPAAEVASAPVVGQEQAGTPSSQFLDSLGAPKKSKRSKKSGSSKSADEPAKKAEKPAGKGTIVAMAVGASCSFSVDGASRGASSSVRVQVEAGRHTVSCQPVGGSRRSKSVMVEPGKAATAVFKF